MIATIQNTILKRLFSNLMGASVWLLFGPVLWFMACTGGSEQESYPSEQLSEVDDPLRPQFHYTADSNFLSDPNGLVYYRGDYHLFHQYNPYDIRSGVPQHWAHAVSRDLVHWNRLPIAIHPHGGGNIWSGSAVVDIHNSSGLQTGADPPIVAFYAWQKDGIYYSLSGGVHRNGPGGKQIRANYLFRSKDLAHWEYLHEFVEDDRFTIVGDDGACPYFWPIGERYILPFFSHISGGQYLLGDYDKGRDKFVATSHGKFNFGAARPAGVHAPSAAPDGKGGVIILFNMNEGRPTQGWNQIMTLPRRLTLGSKEELKIEPAGDLESLRYDHQRVGARKLPANQEVVVGNIKGNAMEIQVEIDPKNAPMVEMNVLRSANKEEFTRIAFFKDRGMYQGRNYEIPRPADWKPVFNSLITLESSYSSLLPDVLSRAPETAPVHLEAGETLKLRIFIDKSVVEVFVNGKQCLAVRVYPSREDSVGVSFRSQGQDSELLSLQAWQMKNIYD